MAATLTGRQAACRHGDVLPPTLTALEARAGADQIVLRFSEPLHPASALAPGNYSLTGNQIVSLELEADGQGVVLRTPTLVAGQDLRLRLDGLTDVSAARNVLVMELAFQPLAAGYRERVLQSQPVRYWRFEETTGASLASDRTELDSAATATASAINGVALVQPGLIPGDPATLALGFDGAASQRLDIPNDADLNITAAPWSRKTVELWFRAGRLPNVVQGAPQVATLYEQGGDTRALALYLYGTREATQPATADLVWFAFNDGTGDGPGDGWGPARNNAVAVKTPIESGRVYHAVAVLDGDETDALRGQLRLYLNGVQVGAVTGAGQLYAHSGDIRVAQGNFCRHDNATGDTGHFSGSLDELALYNRALSGAEAAAHFAAALAIPEEGALPPFVVWARVEDYLVVEFNGVLEGAATITGPWVEIAAESPHLRPIGSAGSPPVLFLRAKQVAGP